MIKDTAIPEEKVMIFELNDEVVFDTALATCQHSILP